MKKITQFALLLVCFLTITIINAQNNRPVTNNVQDLDIFYHTVEQGQTVYSIAKMYDVMVIDIYKLNPGSEEVIKAGQQLKIPQKRFEEKSILNVRSDDNYTIHVIQKDETIFSLSKKYNVNEEKILEANPGLSKATFTIGKRIRIPKTVIQKPVFEIIDNNGVKEVYYTIPANETRYNICKRFKTTEAELLSLNPELAGGLRIGMTIRFPLRINENEIPVTVKPAALTTNAAQNTAMRALPPNAPKIALLLPFDTRNPQPTDNRIQITEYYEGILLASLAMKEQGFSAEIFNYDIGEDNEALTKQLLQDRREDLRKANLIIGGDSPGQIKLIADFAKQNNIKYVIPFFRNDKEVYNNSLIFQANTPPDYLISIAAYAGANFFGKYNIILLDTKEDTLNHTDFIKEFKQELKYRNISYKDAVYNDENFEDNIRSLLSANKPNMIMPVSQSLNAILKITPVLRKIAETNPEYNLTLYGYPRWQTNTYLEECLDDFHALNTYIYSYFYADISHPNMKTFYDNYKKWYSKSPSPTNLKYSMLGYDTGMFFFSALHKFGENFEDHLTDINYKSLQTGFQFERVNNQGGFINTNLYIIHFSKDFTISRSEFK